MSIGILALQGGYAAHARMLDHLDCPWHYVRHPAELEHATGLIIPGGESSTALILLDEEFFSALRAFGQQGKPMFGTCAGAILMATEVLGPQQPSLGLVDVTIQRNAYGRQLDSKITTGSTILKPEPLAMTFIRAPRFTRLGEHVRVIASYNDEPVCVQQDRYLLATFHPELTQDTTLHRYFLDLALQ